MEYFTIAQKLNIPNTAELLIKADSPVEPRAEFLKDQSKKIKKVTTINVIANDISFFPAVFDKPVFLMSTDLRKVVKMHDDSTIWKNVTLANKGNQKYHTYWMPLLDKIPCLSDKTEFYPDKSLKRMVLDPKKIGNSKIFRIGSIRQKIVVVNLDIAESILRRFINGVRLERVQCEGDEDICQM